MKLIVTDRTGKVHELQGRDDWSAMEIIRDANLPLAAECGGDPALTVDRLLAIGAIFGDDLRHDTAVRTLLAGHLRALSTRGARSTVAALLREDSNP